MNFDVPIKENIKDRPLICAHRGCASGNIPCNSLPAFNAALIAGADMIELDVTRSADGKLFVFHPGKEYPHLRSRRSISTMKASAVERLRFVNQDDDKTFLGVNTLDEVLAFLRGKCYINVDKFWTDIPGITECIRRNGVEKQVIVKTSVNEKYLSQLEKYAPDLMFMPVIDREDTVTKSLDGRKINCIGAEVLFSKEDYPVASDEYIKEMHSRGKVLFANAIVYDSRVQLAAEHSDDSAFIKDRDFAWGWLRDRGFDIIQTDHAAALYDYLEGIR